MNNNYPHPIIAKEGWPFILSLTMLLILFLFLHWSLVILVAILMVFVIQFFRDPAREKGSEDPNAVLSAADGRIVVVEKVTDPYRKTPAIKISVFMNVFNVHSNKSPIEGVVEDVFYDRGKFLNAALDKASVENERNAILVETPKGQKITFVQVAGLVARRIICYADKGDHLKAGERYGLIRFGSRVDHYLPIDADVKVAIGDKVTGVKTVLAVLKEPSQEA